MKYDQKGSKGAGNHGEQPTHSHAPQAQAMTHRISSTRGTGFRQLINMLDNNLWLLSGMALGITALIIGWWILSGEAPSRIRLFNKAQNSLQQTDTIGNQTIELLEDRLNGLVDRVETLSDSITSLESKLTRAHVLTDSIVTAEMRISSRPSKQPRTSEAVREDEVLPSSAADQTAVQASSELVPAPRVETVSRAAGTTTDNPASRLSDGVIDGTRETPIDTVAGKQSNNINTWQESAPTVARTESRSPVDRHQTPASAPKGGPWVINLASSPSQADADRFAAKVQSRGIETQQQQVTVKGNRYWRVQTIGFSRVDEAQRYSGIVKEKLGLQDVWITRR